MVLIRKRYYIWLLKAYFKRWKKSILSSLIFGGILFFALLILSRFYIQPKIERKVEKVGLVGVYRIDNLPIEILSELSYGLTTFDDKGNIKPAAAYKWEISEDGKKYIFHLKKDLVFSNGKPLNSKNLHLDFKDVKRKNIDDYKVSYELKNKYSPFLSTVSKPVFIEGFSGLGEFKLKKLEMNADFIKSIVIQDKNDSTIKKIIYFYPSNEALKAAFALGEVDRVMGMRDLKIKESSLDEWKGVQIKKTINYGKLVSLFYNNNDQYLSNKKLRQALNYALPSSFNEGERAYSSILPYSIFYNPNQNYEMYDIEIAKTLMSASNTGEKNLIIEISTTKDYIEVANTIKEAWKKIGVNTTIKVVDEIPTNFQVLLYQFKVPKDPDQYPLWHSNQINNITHYKNLRIDKLIEDGRVITDVNERVKIYRDFQKYLQDDVPSSFLYFPYEYEAERK